MSGAAGPAGRPYLAIMAQVYDNIRDRAERPDSYARLRWTAQLDLAWTRTPSWRQG
jgi:hypothetical protein